LTHFMMGKTWRHLRQFNHPVKIASFYLIYTASSFQMALSQSAC